MKREKKKRGDPEKALAANKKNKEKFGRSKGSE